MRPVAEGVALLSVDGTVVGRYHDGSELAAVLSPRPYLELSTAGGVPVTEVGAEDHAHHFAVSLAVPDVDGITFWGGRTYVRGSGSTLLENHGRQSVTERRQEGARIEEELDWLSPAGERIAREHRELRAEPATDGWVLRWRSTLIAGAAGLSIGSPQTNGRDGAFYGGLFVRTPFRRADVRTADGQGTQAAHGSTSPYLAVSTPAASLVAGGSPTLPWFVRTDEYVGFGLALAVEARRVVAPGESLRTALSLVVLDGALDDRRLDRATAAMGEAAA